MEPFALDEAVVVDRNGLDAERPHAGGTRAERVRVGHLGVTQRQPGRHQKEQKRELAEEFA